MAHNQHMLETRGKDWGDKVRIIGVSIDDSPEQVKSHVTQRKWESVEHFHRGASTVSEDYDVKGVPHVILIDTEGRIAFKGHPMERNLEQDIDSLIAGKKLKGKGIEDGDEEEKEEDDLIEGLDFGEIDKEMQLFKSKIQDVISNQKIK